MPVNARTIVHIGNTLWLLGLAILGAMHLLGISVNGQLVWVCVAGLSIGALGYWWAHFIRLIDDDGLSTISASSPGHDETSSTHQHPH